MAKHSQHSQPAGEPSPGYVVRDRRAAPEEETAPPSNVSAEQIAKLQQEVREAKEQSLRTLAEFENTKKRLQRDQETAIRFAAETMIRALLPIVDSLSQALVAVDKQADPQAVIKGVHLIYRQLLGVLNQEGVKRIETVGQLFDPHLHEAVGHVPPQDGQAEGMIVEEIQVGYLMHDKVLRPAMVKVAKKSSPQSTDDSPQMTKENKEEAKE